MHAARTRSLSTAFFAVALVALVGLTLLACGGPEGTQDSGQDSGQAGDNGTPADAAQTGDGGGSMDSSVPPSEVLLPPSLSPILTYCPFTDASDLSRFEGRPVIRVCHAGDTRAGCDVDTLAAAVAQASDGDRIEVVGDGPAYAQCANIGGGLEGVEIVGVCGTPHFQGTVCSLKGAFVLSDARNITLTNLEVSGLAISDSDGANAAAVRDQGLGGLRLRYVYFHDNQNGILGGAGEMHIDWSKFEANGSALRPGFTHNTYFSEDVTGVHIRNSVFLRAAHSGNNMKSRAQAMTFHCSVTASLDGLDSREMDISEGGALTITNSLIQQGPPSENRNLVGFATEATNPDRRHPTQALVVRDSLFVNDATGGSMLVYNAFNGFSLDLARVHFVGSGTLVSNLNGGAETVTETGRITHATRAEAGLDPYSADHLQLPRPPGCPSFEYW